MSGLETVLPLANRRDIDTPIMWPGMSGDDLSNIAAKLQDSLDELRAIQIEMNQMIRLIVYRCANAMSVNWEVVYVDGDLVLQAPESPQQGRPGPD